MTALISTFTLAGLVLCLAAGRKGQGCPRVFAAAWFAALALFIANALLAQALPFGNMRHVLCFFPLAMAPLALYLRRARGIELTAWFAIASAVALAGALMMPMQAAWRQMPALQSPWFAPHVTSYVIAYGLMAVAAALAVKSFWADGQGGNMPWLGKAEAVMRLGFPFMAFGLWSGALWADAAWGRYWAWDIKEVWSLMTWSVYAACFHLPHARARRWLILAGFACVVVTFLVVNLLPRLESVHSYAQ